MSKEVLMLDGAAKAAGSIVSSQNVTAISAVVLSGLLAGLFYGYACSVNIGLGKLNDAEYLKAMQSINVAILNPVFFLSFMGALLALPMATWLSYNGDSSLRFYLFLTATVIYAIGVFGVTAAGNVPLNDVLANLNINEATQQQLTSYRNEFELPWNKLHLMRTVASVLTFLLSLISTTIK